MTTSVSDLKVIMSRVETEMYFLVRKNVELLSCSLQTIKSSGSDTHQLMTKILLVFLRASFNAKKVTLEQYSRKISN